MNFAALPPEVNSALMYTGAGSGPIRAAATAWTSMAAELETAASSYRSVITGLAAEPWQGPASVSMAAAAAPYVAWMSATAAQAGQAATQATAAATAYETAFTMTVPPPVIAANRAQLTALVATNFLGQNTPAIAATEAHYGQMWAQDAAAMYAYAGSAAAATELTSFTAPKQNTNPGGLDNQATSVAQTTGSQAASRLAAAAATAGPSQLAGTATGTTTGATEGAISPGLAFDLAGAALEIGSVGPFGAIGLGGGFGGMAITLGELAFPEGAAGFGALGGLGLMSGVAPAAGGLGTPLAGFIPTAGPGGLGRVGATWASMGNAVPLGSLSVPQVWAAAAPSAVRDVALVSAGSTTAATSAAAVGGSEIPYAEMALASMAGRAMAGSAGLNRRERPATTTHARPQPPQDEPDKPVKRVGVVAELRALIELRDSGILTEEKFNQRKQRLLGGCAGGGD